MDPLREIAPTKRQKQALAKAAGTDKSLPIPPDAPPGTEHYSERTLRYFRDARRRLLPGSDALAAGPHSNARQLVRQKLAGRMDAIVQAIGDKAVGGDVNAQALALRYAADKEPIHIEGYSDATDATGKLEALLQAVANGDVAVDDGLKMAKLISAGSAKVEISGTCARCAAVAKMTPAEVQSRIDELDQMRAKQSAAEKIQHDYANHPDRKLQLERDAADIADIAEANRRSAKISKPTDLVTTNPVDDASDYV